MKGRMFKAIATVLLWVLGHAAHAGAVTYVYTDPQGTPLAEADVSGNITATFDYRPYGAQALGTAQDGPAYTGHVNDADTGLVYMQARYYEWEIGRFISVDPNAPVQGNVFQFNRYDYANNNPISYIDPDGRESGCVSRNVACLHGPMNVPGLVKHGEVSVGAAMGAGARVSIPLDGNDPEVGIIMIGEGASISLDGKIDPVSIQLPSWAEQVPINVAVAGSFHLIYGVKFFLVINDDGKLVAGASGGFGVGETLDILSVNHKVRGGVADMLSRINATQSAEDAKKQREWEERHRERQSMDYRRNKTRF